MRRARGESGQTLVELLVVILLGIVVLGAAFYVIEVAFRASVRTTDRVDATQRGREALQQITQELHSTCVGPGVIPIVSGSDANHVVFISQYGSGVTLTPNQHVLTYSPTAHTLVDATYAATGGTAPNWTFSSTPSSSRLELTNVYQSGTTPVFQYFAYTGTDLSTTGLGVPLSSTNAALASAVTISYQASPLSGSTEAGRAIDFSDQVVMRVSAAPDTAGSSPVGPCA